MCSGKSSVIFAVCLVVLLGLAGNAFAIFGGKELDNEKMAVTFAKEVERGGYKIIITQELKSLMEQKKEMLVVDTMPYEASYKKNHIPEAVPMEFPIPEMTTMDEKKRTSWKSCLARTRTE